MYYSDNSVTFWGQESSSLTYFRNNLITYVVRRFHNHVFCKLYNKFMWSGAFLIHVFLE